MRVHKRQALARGTFERIVRIQDALQHIQPVDVLRWGGREGIDRCHAGCPTISSPRRVARTDPLPLAIDVVYLEGICWERSCAPDLTQDGIGPGRRQEGLTHATDPYACGFPRRYRDWRGNGKAHCSAEMLPFRASAGGGGVSSRGRYRETCHRRSALENMHIVLQPAKHRGKGCQMTSLPPHLI